MTFPALDLASGSNRVEVALSPGDDLAGDDQRYLAIKRPEPRKVLIVAQDAEGRGPLFASTALETLTTLALTADVRTSALGDPPLLDYSFVVVTDVGLLDARADGRRSRIMSKTAAARCWRPARAPAASRRCP